MRHKYIKIILFIYHKAFDSYAAYKLWLLVFDKFDWCIIDEYIIRIILLCPGTPSGIHHSDNHTVMDLLNKILFLPL